MNNESTPFSGLSPDLVLDAVETLGLDTDGRLLALNSYENRVYQVGLDGTPPVIVKFYRPGRWSDGAILEEHDFSRELADREIPAVPPAIFGDRTLHQHRGFRFSVTPCRGGRTPEMDGPGVLAWIRRLLGCMHAIGELRPFQQRPTLDIASFGEEPRAYLLANGWLPADLEDTYRNVSEHALAAVRDCFERAGEFRRLRLHSDCHPGNMLWTDEGPHFVDFDDTRMGPAIQDLWMLLSGDRAEMANQLGRVLAGYENFHALDPRELHLLEALRTLRLLHYSAWIARRWNDPAFPATFTWFGTQHYWQDRILELREQIAAMEEGPLPVL